MTIILISLKFSFIFYLQVCKKGAPLTPEQASILKLLEIQMAQFKLNIKCHWTKGKGYHKDKDEQSDEVVEDEEMEDMEDEIKI